ncbi:MAG: hypothetical protein Kow00121_10530 [Elainellaceae cyanobacterium]
MLGTFIILGSTQLSLAAVHSATSKQEFYSIRDSRTEAIQILELGEEEYLEGRYQNAITLYHQALSILQTVGNQTEISRTLYAIGLAYYSSRQYLAALDFYHQSLEVYQALYDSTNVAKTLHAIGLVYYDLNEYSEALAFYQQSLAIPEYLQDKTRLGNLLFANGLALYRLGKYSDALEYYQQALTIAQDADSPSDEAAILHSIGIIYTTLGQYSQAAGYYQQAMVLLRDGDDIAAQGRLFDSIGFNYFQQNQYQQAVDTYQSALTLHVQVGNFLGEGRTLNNLGQTYLLLEQYPQALSSLEKALEIVHQLDDRNYESSVLDSLAELYSALRQYSVAFELYQQSLIIVKEIGDRAGEAITLSKLGELFIKQGSFEIAIVFYKQSVNVTESIREDLRSLPLEQQRSYTETIAGTYRALAALLLEQGRILEAQQVLELLKVEELREFTNERATLATNGIQLTEIEQSIVEEHNSLIAFGQRVDECQQNRCNELNALLDQRELLTQQFNQTIQTFEAEVRDRLSQDRAVLDTQDFNRAAQEILDEQPGTVIVYPFVLEDKLWVLWATSGGVVNSVEIPVTRQQLGETVLKFRQLLDTPTSDIEQVQATAQLLYGWLIAPLEAELAAGQVQHLVLSLDRVTRYIPIAALFDGEQYLIERYTVSTILSADLTDVRDRLSLRTEDMPILALGLSEAVPPDFSALSYVPDELDAIVLENATDASGIYPGLKFLNGEFDQQTLRNNLYGHRILHIATHAVFEPGRQDQSYLLLGTGEQFRIADIQNLQDLGDLQLVVLSACETALGEPDQDGIEIPGIAFNFLNGGADTVIASLWAVSDSSTASLMQQFYQTLAAGTPAAPVTRSEALRQAQLSLLNGDATGTATADRGIVELRVNPEAIAPETAALDYSHPYYWAPFILIGNGL